jgi:hypothetical protein
MFFNESDSTVIGEWNVTGVWTIPSIIHLEVVIRSIHTMEHMHKDFFFSISLPNKVKIVILSKDFFVGFLDSIDNNLLDS